MINPGKGLPLFPSEQFWSLQVMYCDPVDKQEISAKNMTNKQPSSDHNQGLAAYADGIKWATEAKFWMPLYSLFLLIDKVERAVLVC